MSAPKLAKPLLQAGLTISEEIGAERFTVNDYFHKVTGVRYQVYPTADWKKAIDTTLTDYVARGLLISAPGPRGGAGWKLNPAVQPQIDRFATAMAKEAAAYEAARQAERVRYEQIREAPVRQRAELAAQLGALGLADSDREFVLAAIDSYVSAILLSRRVARRGLHGL